MTSELSAASGRSSRTAPGVADRIIRPRPRVHRPSAALVWGILPRITCVPMVLPFLWAALSSTKPTDVALANPPGLAPPPAFADTPTFTPLGQNLSLRQQASSATGLWTLPALGVAVIAQKYLLAGLASGAVQG
ncbi:hypothetical protein [uncultured Friedmanniella sp.]|uniref:hypothetical protein n=1 Tax=uncultured Friedmanniella sp. TaxID=335381 RepID=UPI0035CB2CB2